MTKKQLPEALQAQIANASATAQQQELTALKLTIQALNLQAQAQNANLHRERMIGYKQGVLAAWAAAKGIDKDKVMITPNGLIVDLPKSE